MTVDDAIDRLNDIIGYDDMEAMFDRDQAREILETLLASRVGAESEDPP